MAFPSAGPMDPSLGLSSFTMPPPSTGGGMFGGGKFGIAQAISAALNGYLAAMPGPSQAVGLAGLKAQADRRQMQMEEQIYEHRQDLQMQRELSMLPIKAQIALQYPDNGDAQIAYQAGYRPGTPEWLHYMQSLAQNKQDPLTTIPGGGMAPASVARSMLGAGAPQPAPAGVTFTPIPDQGGPAPQAPGGFLGSPYPPIDGYSRY